MGLAQVFHSPALQCFKTFSGGHAVDLFLSGAQDSFQQAVVGACPGSSGSDSTPSMTALHEDMPWSSCASIARKIEAKPEYRSVPEHYRKFRLAANVQIPALELFTGSRKRTLEQSCCEDAKQVEVSICTFNMLAQGLLDKRCKDTGEAVSPDMVWEARRERVLRVMQRSPGAKIEPDIFAM